MKDFARRGFVFGVGISVLIAIGCNTFDRTASLWLSPSVETYSAQAADAAYTISVTSARADGAPIDFTVVSDNPGVVSVSKGATSGYITPVTLTPLAEGSATITFTSFANPTLTRTIKATISAKPVATLALSPSSLSYTANVGDTGYIVNVTALKNDGTADDFSVSSNSNAVTVGKGATTGSVTPVTLTPVAEGNATITFKSGSDSTLIRTISATISPKPIVADTCPVASTTLYFCDDFESGAADNWTLTPNGDGAFSVESTTDYKGVSTEALKYTAGSTASNAVIALLKDSVWAATVGSKTDYYVEARIKPLTNTTLGNKQLYMVAHYTDASNWLLGGLNVQSSSTSTAVESGYMTPGLITRAVQAFRPIVNDTTWYKVRLEMSGTTQTLYMDGENIGSTTSPTSITAGKIGLFTNNKSFYIDDIKVGDSADKPVLLSISPSSDYKADADAAPYVVTVTASKNGSADGFTAISSNPDVVSVAKGTTSGTTTEVSLTPKTAGTVKVTFTSASDTTLSKSITATIDPAYVDSSATYNLSGNVFPAVSSTTVYPEDNLQITFDSAPTLGTEGTIRIFKASDDTLVDRINLSNESDTIGRGTYRRGVATTPIQINGNTVTITPHSGKLVSGTSYYVGISDTVFPGATLAGTTFAGIGKAAGWTFTVKSTTPATGLSSVTVAPASDTTADFHSIQAALNYYMTNSSVSSPVINVKNGTYNELLYLFNRANVTILGESRAGVIIQYNNYESLNSGSGGGASGTPTSGGGRSVLMVENSDMFTLDTLTLKNTHIRNGQYSNQAEAIYFKSSTASSNSGHRLVAKNANFYSEQNTLQLQGYTWFYNTKISGNTDFILGNNYVSLFEASTIEMLGDSMHPATVSGYENGTGGYIVQASTYYGGKGFIFAGSVLTYADGPSGVHVATGSNASSYLARAVSGTWADNVAYLNCKMDTHIAALGWASGVSGNPVPNPATPTAASGWREYGSMDISGATLSVSGRSTNSKQLASSDVSTAAMGDFTQTLSYPISADRATIFSTIGWAPVP